MNVVALIRWAHRCQAVQAGVDSALTPGLVVFRSRSGGKDSCFNMMQCIANGHSIVALANLYPAPEAGTGASDRCLWSSASDTDSARSLLDSNLIGHENC